MNAFSVPPNRGINFAKIRGFKVTDYSSFGKTGGGTPDSREVDPCRKHVNVSPVRRPKKPSGSGNLYNSIKLYLIHFAYTEFKKTPFQMPAGHSIYLFILRELMFASFPASLPARRRDAPKGRFRAPSGRPEGKGTLLPGTEGRKGRPSSLRGRLRRRTSGGRRKEPSCTPGTDIVSLFPYGFGRMTEQNLAE